MLFNRQSISALLPQTMLSQSIVHSYQKQPLINYKMLFDLFIKPLADQQNRNLQQRYLASKKIKKQNLRISSIPAPQFQPKPSFLNNKKTVLFPSALKIFVGLHYCSYQDLPITRIPQKQSYCCCCFKNLNTSYSKMKNKRQVVSNKIGTLNTNIKNKLLTSQKTDTICMLCQCLTPALQINNLETVSILFYLKKITKNLVY